MDSNEYRKPLMRRMEANPSGFGKFAAVYGKIARRERYGYCPSLADRFRFFVEASSGLTQADLDALPPCFDPSPVIYQIWMEYQAELGGYDDVNRFIADVYGRNEAE